MTNFEHPNQKKVEIADIQNLIANTEGEYFQHLNVSAALINLAFKSKVLTAEECALMVHDTKDAKNAYEVLMAQRALTRILYRHAIDYSDILLSQGVIDSENHKELKSNIARGKEFTNRDLDDADHIDTVGARAGSGEEDPQDAAQQIHEGLERMHLRKKIYPDPKEEEKK